MKINRRQSRETAFTLIFEWSFRQEETLDEVVEQAKIGRSLIDDDFARTLAQRTIDNCVAIDKKIEDYSLKWKLNRIPRVNLTVLRMAMCELSYFPDIPAGATINEAVELVKKFATEEDAAYLNGILGQFERDRSSKAKAQAGEQALTKERTQALVSQQSLQEADEAEVEASVLGEVE